MHAFICMNTCRHVRHWEVTGLLFDSITCWYWHFKRACVQWSLGHAQLPVVVMKVRLNRCSSQRLGFKHQRLGLYHPKIGIYRNNGDSTIQYPTVASFFTLRFASMSLTRWRKATEPPSTRPRIFWDRWDSQNGRP